MTIAMPRTRRHHGRPGAGLVELYDATSRPAWRGRHELDEGCAAVPMVQVRIDADARVTGLELVGNELSGRNPPASGNPSNPVDLSLHGNALSGPIPPALGSVANLNTLWFSDNGLGQ